MAHLPIVSRHLGNGVGVKHVGHENSAGGCERGGQARQHSIPAPGRLLSACHPRGEPARRRWLGDPVTTWRQLVANKLSAIVCSWSAIPPWSVSVPS